MSGPRRDRESAAEVGNELDVLRTVYPRATFLGPVEDADGPGTPQALLARLPGSGSPSPAVVHLACHALAEEDPERSVIDLVEPLSVASVLRQGARRDGVEPGPVVVLAACDTALTRGSDDEALTLATAFLAAGAVSVVGSLWKVNNRYTAVLMVVFHHFHHTERLPAAEALRRTQLWALLGRGRPAVEDLLRPGTPLPPWLRAGLPSMSSVAMWAAFTHHGR